MRREPDTPVHNLDEVSVLKVPEDRSEAFPHFIRQLFHALEVGSGLSGQAFDTLVSKRLVAIRPLEEGHDKSQEQHELLRGEARLTAVNRNYYALAVLSDNHDPQPAPETVPFEHNINTQNGLRTGAPFKRIGPGSPANDAGSGVPRKIPSRPGAAVHTVTLESPIIEKGGAFSYPANAPGTDNPLTAKRL